MMIDPSRAPRRSVPASYGRRGPLPEHPGRLEAWIARDSDPHLDSAYSAESEDPISPALAEARRAFTPSKPKAAIELHMAFPQGFTVASVPAHTLLHTDVVQSVLGQLIDLACHGHARMVLNLRQVHRASCELWAGVDEADRLCREVGGLLKLCGLLPELGQALSILGLDRRLVIETDVFSAIEGHWPLRPPLRPLPIERLLPLWRSDGSRPHRRPRHATWAAERPRSPAVRLRPHPGPGFEDLVAAWVSGGDGRPAAEAPDPSDATWRPATVRGTDREGQICYEILTDVLVATLRPARLEFEGDVAPVRRAFKELLSERSPDLPRRVVLDLSRLVGLSGRGLGLIVAHGLRLSRAGGALRIARVAPRIGAELTRLQLDRLVGIYPTVEDAVLTNWDRPMPPE